MATQLSEVGCLLIRQRQQTTCEPNERGNLCAAQYAPGQSTPHKPLTMGQTSQQVC
jgi:hypothetical protein